VTTGVYCRSSCPSRQVGRLLDAQALEQADRRQAERRLEASGERARASPGGARDLGDR
jgi:hypothetical protein